VGRSIAIAILAAALGLAAPLVAYAAGLGRLTVEVDQATLRLIARLANADARAALNILD